MTEETLRDILEGRLKGKSALMEVLDRKDGGQSLEVTIRDAHPEEPEISRNMARQHRFGNIKGMLDYLSVYSTNNTVVFADVENLSMEIVVDESSKFMQETLSMVPAVHPLWKPWVNICGDSDYLRNIVTFLRHNRRQIVEPNGRELVLTLSQIKGSTELELHQGVGNNSVNGLLVRSKVEGAKGTEMVELPESIVVRCPIFIDEPPVDSEIDLILETSMSNGKPEIHATLNASDLKKAELDLFQVMCDRVRDFCNDNEIVFTYGRGVFTNWKTVTSSS